MLVLLTSSVNHFEAYRKKISVIHDGIDTNLACLESQPKPFLLSSSLALSKSDKVITFVNRTLEPYRGCHTLFALFL